MKITFQFNRKETILKKNVTHSKKRSPLLFSPSNPGISERRKESTVFCTVLQVSKQARACSLYPGFPARNFLSRVKKPHRTSTSQSIIGFVLFLYFISFNYFKEISFSSKNLQDSVRHFERLLWSLLFSWPSMLSTIKKHSEKARTYLKRYSTLTVIFKMLKNEIYLCICLFIYQSGWKRWGKNCYYSVLVSIYENNPFLAHVMII